MKQAGASKRNRRKTRKYRVAKKVRVFKKRKASPHGKKAKKHHG